MWCGPFSVLLLPLPPPEVIVIMGRSLLREPRLLVGVFCSRGETEWPGLAEENEENYISLSGWEALPDWAGNTLALDISYFAASPWNAVKRIWVDYNSGLKTIRKVQQGLAFSGKMLLWAWVKDQVRCESIQLLLLLLWHGHMLCLSFPTC